MSERRDDSLQTTLRAQGYRLTPQRQLVLRAVTELRHGTTDEDHLLLDCRVCGQIIETDVSVADHLIEDLATQQGFVTDVTHFAIFGRCKDCVS